jgi:Fuc2NAc and GlcNAc transferase
MIRYIAYKKELLDHPNERSSHTMPTPKGGGFAIMTALYGVLVYLYLQTLIDPKLFFALLSALPVVIISLIDDVYPLSARMRLGVQLTGAVAALYFLGGVDSINFSFFSLHGVWLNLIALFGIIWIANLYNFLDGIDGYAGSEAVFVGAAAYLLLGNETGLLIASAALGFLLFNWHKASIFMGDVGSAPLGFIFAVLALHDAPTANFPAWVVLLSLFWFDATVTLWRRFKNGEKLSTPHKKHAYQRLHQAGFSHDRVVLWGMTINAVLFAMLWLAGEANYWLVLLAAVLLLWLAMMYVDSKKAFH